jgi:hypothetical protein
MPENEKEGCPAGNSGKWLNHQWVPDSHKVILFRLKGKEGKGKGKAPYESNIRNKISAKGKLVVEHLTIDRIRKVKPVHLVEELDEKGNWITKHYEIDEPFKTYPKKTKP